MRPTSTIRARDLRRHITKVEWRLWSRLRMRQLDGRKFRRQAAIGPFTADFACFDARLVVEVDSPTHDEERTRHDAARDAWLRSIGFRVLRFDADQVAERIDDVVDAVLRELRLTASPSLTLPREWGGTESPHRLPGRLGGG